MRLFKGTKSMVLVGVIGFFISSCFQGPGLMKQSGTAENAGIFLKTKNAGDGVLEFDVSANLTTNQSLDFGDGNTLTIPPNSLDLNTTISYQEGTSLSTSQMELTTGLTSLESASQSIVLLSSSSTDPASAMSLSLSLSTGASLRLNSTSESKSLVVLFRVYSAREGKYLEGYLPAANLLGSNNKVTIPAKYFGSYQLAYTSKKDLKGVIGQASAGIFTKRDEKVASAVQVIWKVGSRVLSNSFETINATATGMTFDGAACTCILDTDKAQPFQWIKAIDARAMNASISSLSLATIFGVKRVFVRFECLESSGRLLQSEWSVFREELTGGASSPSTNTASSGSGGLSVTAFSPTGSSVGIFSPINISFSKAITVASLSASAQVRRLKDPGSILPGGWVVDANGTGASFLSPPSGWPRNGEIEVFIAGSLADAAGTATLGTSYSAVFQTVDGSFGASEELLVSSLPGAPAKMEFAQNTHGQSVLATIRGTDLVIDAFNGTTWVSSSYASMSDTPPAVVINDSGQAIVVARMNSGIFSVINVDNLSSSGSWAISTAGLSVHGLRAPILRASKDGAKAVLAFYEGAGPSDIKVCTINFGSTVCSTNGASIIGGGTYTYSYDRFVDACITNSGKILLAYKRGTGNTLSRVSLYDGITWTSDIQVLAVDIANNSNVSAVCNANDAWVVAGGQVPSTMGIAASKANSAFNTLLPVVEVDSMSGYDLDYIIHALSPSGKKARISFTQFDGSNYRLKYVDLDTVANSLSTMGIIAGVAVVDAPTTFKSFTSSLSSYMDRSVLGFFRNSTGSPSLTSFFNGSSWNTTNTSNLNQGGDSFNCIDEEGNSMTIAIARDSAASNSHINTFRTLSNQTTLATMQHLRTHAVYNYGYYHLIGACSQKSGIVSAITVKKVGGPVYDIYHEIFR